MISPEADILLAIHALKDSLRETSTDVICRHVYGHQDSSRTRAKPPHSDGVGLPSRPPRETLINIECDRIATETSRVCTSSDNVDHMPPAHSMPYPGSRACFRIGPRWITTNTHQEILWAQQSRTTLDYCRTKYHWDPPTLGSIHWEVIRLARSKIGKTQFMQTSKIMHGWLPVMHMHGHSTGITVCPCCGNPDETMDHLLQCESPQMRRTRSEAYICFRKKCAALNLPLQPFTALMSYIRHAFLGEELEEASTTLTRATYSQQATVGSTMLLRGFITKRWAALFSRYGTPLPTHLLSKILRFIWSDLIGPVWTARNDTLHNSVNKLQSLEQDTLNTRLQWFLENGLDAISFHDQFLLSFSVEDIDTMTLHIRRERCRQLEVAQQAYRIEKTQRKRGQTTITSFFRRTPQPTAI